MICKISASAGSGKTWTLTRRFLQMLQQAHPDSAARGCGIREETGVFSLSEILAATFTNKAAAEMKERVVSQLKTLALAPPGDSCEDPGLPSPAQAAMWVERILRHYGSLNIRTIDSLLANLVRLSAVDLGLAPDFQPCFSSEEYFSPLYDGLMEELKTARHASDSGLLAEAAALRAAVERGCDSLLAVTDCKGFGMRGRLRVLVLELVERMLVGAEVPKMDQSALFARVHVLRTTFTGSAERLLRLLTEQRLSVNANFLKYLVKCAALSGLQSPPSSAYAEKSVLDDCLNKASRGCATLCATDAFAEFLTLSREYGSSLSLFRHALQLAPVVTLAREVHRRMVDSRADDPRLPALCIPYLAGTVLRQGNGVSDALCRMGSRLSRLMLDEFQDTSLAQWEAIRPLALESLACGGSLTYVGDVKQAIYGWRGGDARLFDAIVHDAELAAIAYERVRQESLPCNWRSHPVIIRHNNAFFGLLSDPDMAASCLAAMLPATTPPGWIHEAATQAARYFSDARQDLPPEKTWEQDSAAVGAKVRFYCARGGSTDAVIARVRERLEVLLRQELLAAWRPGDIALLVQSNNEAGLLAEWLTGWRIPVVTENSFLLAAHPLVGRLLSFLAFLDYPLDDLAFWESVAGPELLPAACRHAAGKTNGFACPLPSPDWPALKRSSGKNIPLYQLFKRDFPEAWERWIAPFFSEAGLMSAYDTLREIIRRYELDAIAPQDLPFLHRLLEVAHLAETRGHSSLAAFLSFWESCKEDEKLPLPENMEAVRIMTIHKAKGLEFPVVVLPFQHKASRRDPKLTVVDRQGMRILTRADKCLEQEYYPGAIMNELERLNLLYVAWTRPVYALHAFITRPDKGSGLTRALELLIERYRAAVPEDAYEWEDLPDHPEEKTVRSESHPSPALPGPAKDASGPACAKGLFPEPRRPDPVSSAPVPPSQTPPAIFGSVAAPWRPMGWLPRLKIYRSSLESARLTPKRRGILAHLCLEHLSLSVRHPEGNALPEDFLACIRADVRRAVRQAMRLFPMPLEDPERTSQEMEECLYWFACLPEAGLWLKTGRREQGIADAAGNMHRVDLVVEETGTGAFRNLNVLHALDYKTGAFPDPRGFREHRDQVRRYMGLLHAASGKPVRGSLIYLDARKVEPVPTEEQ